MIRRANFVQYGMTAAAMLVSLAITALLVLAVGKNPVEVFEKVWEGAFRNTTSLATVFNFWIPLTLCGLGLVVTFTAGLWNIGVEGQMAMGAVFAAWAALYVDLPPLLLIPLEIVLAMLGGALWAALVGFLKLRLGVHEIFGGVALNALSTVLTIYLISGPWQPPEGGSAQGTQPFQPNAILPTISPDFTVSALALAIVIIAVVGVTLALRGTRWGLMLKATGKNPRSALLLGVPTQQSSFSALMVCGALAGIAGAYRVLLTFGNLRPLTSGGIGFLALLVVLLVAMRPILVPLVTFIFAAIYVGSTRLKVSLQLDQSLADVIQGTVVLLVILGQGVREKFEGRGSTPSAKPAAPETREKPLTQTPPEAAR